MQPGKSSFYHLSNNCSKMIFGTIMQLKFGHGYFRSYLYRLKDYNSSKCTNRCNERQTPEHQLLNCNHYFEEIQIMKQSIDTTINLNILFNTKIGNDISVKSELIYAETLTNFTKTNCKIENSITIGCY